MQQLQSTSSHEKPAADASKVPDESYAAPLPSPPLVRFQVSG